MTKLEIIPGHTYDVVSPKELQAHTDSINKRMDDMMREAVRGIKPIRLSSGIVTAITTFLKLPLGMTPKSGYIWVITRLTVGNGGSGLAASPMIFRTTDPSNIVMTSNLTPDQYSLSRVVSTFPSSSNLTQTFSKGSLLLNAGEYLVMGISDPALATNSYSFQGEAIEVPAEMIGKLLI